MGAPKTTRDSLCETSNKQTNIKEKQKNKNSVTTFDHAAVESTFVHEEMGIAKLGSAFPSRLLWNYTDTYTRRPDRRWKLFEH